jgi:hypothetical protein
MKLTYIVLTVFNQKTLYDAYKKRTKNVEVDLEEYNRMKEADPEFYRDASSLQYGKVQFCRRNAMLPVVVLAYSNSPQKKVIWLVVGALSL